MRYPEWLKNLASITLHTARFKLNCISILSLGSIGVGSSGISQARFYHLDAPELDQEKDRSDEYFNDVLSYRENPIDKKNTNFLHVLAGSLDAKRFYYEEMINFEKCLNICIALEHQKQQDKVFEYEQLDLKIRGASGKIFSPGFLTSLDAHKERADLGALAQFKLGEWSFDLELWSVDHYFNTKKKLNYQNFEKKPRTLVTRTGYKHRLFDFVLTSSLDYALEWRDGNYFDAFSNGSSISYPDNRQIEYRYESRKIDLQVLGREFPFYLNLSRSEKSEQLRSYISNANHYQKFHRRWTKGELWWKEHNNNNIFYAIEFHSLISSLQSISEDQGVFYSIDSRSLGKMVIPREYSSYQQHNLQQSNGFRKFGLEDTRVDAFETPFQFSFASTHYSGAKSQDLTRSLGRQTQTQKIHTASAINNFDSDSIFREVLGLRFGKYYQFTSLHGGLLDSTMHWGGQRYHLKLGTHYLYSLASNASLRFIVTWDLDKAFSNFKKNESIRPWGGGGFSIVADL